MQTGREEGGNYESRGQEPSGKQVNKWERWERELGEKRVGTGREGNREWERGG